MAIGAVYLLTLLMNDGQSEQDQEETLAEYAADTATSPAAKSESGAGDAAAPAEAQQH
jgi:hypothetical protein